MANSTWLDQVCDRARARRRHPRLDDRYKLADHSKTKLWCFKYSIIDTLNPATGEPLKNPIIVCECSDREQAVRILEALNQQQGGKGTE